MFFPRSKRQALSPFVILFLVITALGVVAALYFYAVSHKDALTSLSKDLTSELKVFSGLVTASTEKHEFLPRLVSEYGVVADVLTDPHDRRKIAQANLLLERLNKEAGVADIYIMDADGDTIASSNWNMKHSFLGKNYAFRPYFYEAMNKGDGRFYAIGVTSRAPGLYLAHRILRNNTPLGVVAVKVNISSLPANWESTKFDILVADERDIIFLSSRSEWRYRPLWRLTGATHYHVDSTRQYEGMFKDAPAFEMQDILGPNEKMVRDGADQSWFGLGARPYFVKSYALPGSDWTIHAVAPMDSINEHARMAAYFAFGSAVLVVFMLVGANQFYLRSRERNKYLRELEETHQILEKKNNELQALNQELHLHSITDPLTGVFNRRHFMKLTSQSLSLSNRHGFPLSVLMIDVDHFKKINDTYGHPAGDEVLQTLVAFVKEELRESDIVARWGGEEFVIALPHADEGAAALVAERIRTKVMEHLFNLGSECIRVTVSSGVAQCHAEESDINAAIKRADHALYEAKRSGRNKVCPSSSFSL